MFDSSKYGQATFSRVAPLSAANDIVTDSEVPEQIRTNLADTQADLLILGPAADSSGPARAR